MPRLGDTVVRNGMEYAIYAIILHQTFLIGKSHNSSGQLQYFDKWFIEIETKESRNEQFQSRG